MLPNKKISVGLDLGGMSTKIVLSEKAGTIDKHYHLSATKAILDQKDHFKLFADQPFTLDLPHKRHFSQLAALIKGCTYSLDSLSTPDSPHTETLVIGSILHGLSPEITEAIIYLTVGIPEGKDEIGKGFVQHYRGKHITGKLKGRPEVNLVFKYIDWDYQAIWGVLGKSLSYSPNGSIDEDEEVGESHYVVIDGGSAQIKVCEVLPGYVLGPHDSEENGTWTYLKELRRILQSVHKGKYLPFTVMQALTKGELTTGNDNYPVAKNFKPIIEEYCAGVVNLVRNTVSDWTNIRKVFIMGGMAEFLLPVIRNTYGPDVGEDHIVIISDDPIFFMAQSMEISSRYEILYGEESGHADS
jgi:hypothetical protein